MTQEFKATNGIDTKESIIELWRTRAEIREGGYKYTPPVVIQRTNDYKAYRLAGGFPGVY